MACSGALTGLVLTAAGGFVTNGALAGTFGAAPFSSLAGAPLSLADAATGLTNFAPTLSSMTSGLAAISGASGPLSGLGGMVGAISGAGFSTNMLSAFNAIPTDLGVGGGLFDAIAGFAPEVNDLMTTVTGGSGVLNDALKFAGDWSADTLGGTFAGIGGDVIGNPAKFGTILNTASSYVTNANQMINAATNSGAIGSTFTGLNNMVSGSLAGVNLDFGGFGEEIGKLGSTINLDNISNLGNPGQLLANMSQQGTLGPLYSKLGDISVDAITAESLGGIVGDATSVLTLANAGVDLNSLAQQGANLPTNVQKEVYNVLGDLDTTEVAQVKNILGNSQDLISKGTDLLDPKKLFPTSFETFTAPLRTASVGFRAVYENETGSVNPQFEDLGQKLKGILPDDVAVANGAISRSLGQVKNVGQTNASDVGTALTNLETLKDLDLLENQETYVTEGVQNYWLETFGVDSDNDVQLATGNAGQLQLTDVIGFAAGYNSAAPITKNAQLLQEMADAGELDDVTGTGGVYDTIVNFANGTFGPNGLPEGSEPPYSSWEIVIPPGYLAAGTYTGDDSDELKEDVWINHVVPAVKTVIASFASNSRAIEIQANSKRWNEQLAREYLNQSKIDNADLTAVRASEDVAINLALNLPNLGNDTAEGGTAEILERIVDFSSLGGQATIGAMREGRNLKRLADANIQQDAPLDTSGVQNPGNFVSSTYNATEAKDQLIKS